MRDHIGPGLSPNPFMPKSIPGFLTLKELLTSEAWMKKKKVTLNCAVSGLPSALNVIPESNYVDLLKSVADHKTEGSVLVSFAVDVISNERLMSSVCEILQLLVPSIGNIPARYKVSWQSAECKVPWVILALRQCVTTGCELGASQTLDFIPSVCRTGQRNAFALCCPRAAVKTAASGCCLQLHQLYMVPRGWNLD